VIQGAIDWIRGTTKDNNQAMDQYMAGDADLDLFFGHHDVRGDLIAHFLRGNKQVSSFSLNNCAIAEGDLLSLLSTLQSNTSVLIFRSITRILSGKTWRRLRISSSVMDQSRLSFCQAVKLTARALLCSAKRSVTTNRSEI
jgi:hypothetical protein